MATAVLTRVWLRGTSLSFATALAMGVDVRKSITITMTMAIAAVSAALGGERFGNLDHFRAEAG